MGSRPQARRGDWRPSTPSPLPGHAASRRTRRRRRRGRGSELSGRALRASRSGRRSPSTSADPVSAFIACQPLPISTEEPNPPRPLPRVSQSRAVEGSSRHQVGATVAVPVAGGGDQVAALPALPHLAPGAEPACACARVQPHRAVGRAHPQQVGGAVAVQVARRHELAHAAPAAAHLAGRRRGSRRRARARATARRSHAPGPSRPRSRYRPSRRRPGPGRRPPHP